MDREASEGQIFSYVHHNGKIGVLVQLNCETDFVARTDKFRELGKNIAMHIAASDPQFISPEEVSEDVVQKEREIQRKILLEEGKSESVIEKILEGKIKKFKSEICLLEQAYINDPQLTVGDVIKEAISTLGENIRVARFVRFSMK